MSHIITLRSYTSFLQKIVQPDHPEIWLGSRLQYPFVASFHEFLNTPRGISCNRAKYNAKEIRRRLNSRNHGTSFGTIPSWTVDAEDQRTLANSKYAWSWYFLKFFNVRMLEHLDSYQYSVKMIRMLCKHLGI